MFTRRNLFRALFGLPVAAVMAKTLPAPKPVMKPRSLGMSSLLFTTGNGQDPMWVVWPVTTTVTDGTSPANITFTVTSSEPFSVTSGGGVLQFVPVNHEWSYHGIHE